MTARAWPLQVAFRRISAFLRLPEMDPRPVLPRDAEVGLRVSGATFTWTEADSETADGEPHKAPALQGTPKAAPTFTTPHPMASNVFRLRNIDLVVPRGQLVALVGRVRCCRLPCRALCWCCRCGWC